MNGLKVKSSSFFFFHFSFEKQLETREEIR